MSFQDALDIFEAYGFDYKIPALITATAAVATLKGDPTWLMVVGPSSSLKTELLNLFAPKGLCIYRSTLSPPAIMPSKATTSSLLYKVDQQTLVVKDFTVLLTSRPHVRDEVFSYLRDAFDGHCERETCEGNFKWDGSFTFVSACTPVIEMHRDYLAVLGERFLYVTMPLGEPNHLGVKVREGIRKEVVVVINKLIKDVRAKVVNTMEPELTTPEDRAVIRLICHLRTPVMRRAYNREIELPPAKEQPFRLCNQVNKLMYGLQLLKIDRKLQVAAINHLLLSCIPIRRRLALGALTNGHGLQTVLKGGRAREETTEDLIELDILEKKSGRYALQEEYQSLKPLFKGV